MWEQGAEYPNTVQLHSQTLPSEGDTVGGSTAPNRVEPLGGSGGFSGIPHGQHPCDSGCAHFFNHSRYIQFTVELCCEENARKHFTWVSA